MRNLYNFLLYKYYSLQLGPFINMVFTKGGHQVRMDLNLGEGGLDPENVHI